MRPPRLLLVISAFVVAQGCRSFQQRAMPGGEIPELSMEQPVRVTLNDGNVLVLEHPRVAGDSLIGDGGNPPQRFVVLRRDIARIEQSSVSALRTGGLVLGVGTVVVAVLAVIAIATLTAVLI